ncbi:MAG: hypothetical protein HKN40_01310 [Winogradskyella sp.]|uniref:hypothetical protein n=1 Tax=Winogradskyella sp. TaxID=1883156 RepID=UPI00185E0E20|nr:hypothetical protein [Winogradskyella sp.]
MKPFKTLLLTFFIAFTACEKEAPLTFRTVTENFVVTNTITVTNSSTVAQQVSSSELLDMSSNQEISDNQPLILGARINSLSYQITDFTGESNAILSDASIVIGGTQFDIEPINLEAASNANFSFEVNDPYLLEQSSQAFKHGTSSVVLVKGILNTTPVDFKVNVIVNISVAIDNL